MRALQTAGNPFDYRIPDADDEFQIKRGDFELKGWITERHQSSVLDEQDPWAGGISYPPITPAQFVIDLMHLDSDSERRVWRVKVDQRDQDVLWSQLWGQYREKDDETDGGSGSRLQASFCFIVEFLRRIGTDLIVEIQIERRFRHSRYERSKDDDLGFIPRSARLFLAKPDGSLCAI
jgi:hypothetical protein